MEAVRLLIVDDEEDVAWALRHMLQSDGYAIDTVTSGAQAIDAIKTKSYDIVMTDIVMKGVDGFQVLQETKNISPRTAVVLVTGYGSTESAIEALRKSAIDYILKPCEQEELRERIRQVVQKIHKGLVQVEGGGEELITACMFCKKIKVDETWITIESFLRKRLNILVSHGICPLCCESRLSDYN